MGIFSLNLVLLVFALLAASAQAAMVYVYNAPESANDRRYVYHAEVLHMILEATQDEYGPYILKPADMPMNDSRMYTELESDVGRLTVLIRGDLKEMMNRFSPVPIPIDKGLLGYRVLLIRGDRQKKLDEVRDLDDLRRITMGTGAIWGDNEILEFNGLKLVTGASYEGLFKMLATGRFDAFSRGVDEVLDEFDSHKKEYPDIEIEKKLLIHYPMARFFWFNKSKNGQLLLKRVERGFEKILANGSFQDYFDASHKTMIERLQLHDRRLIELRNPIGVASLHDSIAGHWFLPATKVKH